MGIALDIENTLPEVNRNRVFLTRLEITQARRTDDASDPHYKVVVEYSLYGVDGNGVRHFSGNDAEVVVPDFLAQARSEAGKGDMSLVLALQAIEGAVAAIIADDLDTTATLI